ncbi:MAG TPA: anti-sigma factor [Steroidobacteraceae bacterium]|nr:anti-sigma factor [Steroidobacteraceae bacterium]
MKSANRELVDRLAAEYVLGTLRYRARRRFERWLLSPQVGAIVKAWEDRLAGLEPQLTPVTPSAAVWRGIENKLELRKMQRRPAMRWLGVAASLIFFVAVGVFITRPPAQPPMTAQSSLQTDPQTIYWRVEVLGDNQELNLRVQTVHDLPAGKSHELWALPEGGAPVSLGVLPHTGDHHRVLNAAQRAALANSKQIAVSLEVEGGSPTGAPTEVLFAAPLSRA